MIPLLSRLAALTGLLLLALNCWGLLAPNDQRDAFPAAMVMPFQSAVKHLEAIALSTEPGNPGDPANPADIVRTVNTIIHQAMLDQWSRGKTRIPVQQNWLLWLAGFFDQTAVSCGLTDVDKLFSAYQMTDHRRALQRGFGICSQQVLVLAGFLDEIFGYETQVASLSGHMVLQVTLPNDAYMLADPHKGVTLPFGLDHAETHPQKVLAAYPASSIVPALYGPEGNQLVPGPAFAYNPKLYLLEKTSYYLIWIIPAGLFLPLLLTRKR